MIDAILTNNVLPAISLQFLGLTAEGRTPERVHIKVDGGEFAYEY
jgi:type VI secretion system protein VasG